MTNDKFKQSIMDLGIQLNGIFYGHDLFLNKHLQFSIRGRKVPSKPNLKHGEVVIIKSISLDPVAEQIARDSLQTVMALHDIVDVADFTSRIKEFDLQIKHQIELTKFAIIKELIKDITPIKQTQFYYQLGMKNAEKLVNGSETDPVF